MPVLPAEASLEYSIKFEITKIARMPQTGENYRPVLELVRCTIPRRVYTNSHIDYVVEGISRLYGMREQFSGPQFVYEPKVLRFFQGRFEPLKPRPF